MTEAQMAANVLGNDGKAWAAADGRTLDAVCKGFGAKVGSGDGVYIEGREAPADPLWLRYLFNDGSAIIDCGSGWDIEGSSPWTWEGSE